MENINLITKVLLLSLFSFSLINTTFAQTNDEIRYKEHPQIIISKIKGLEYSFFELYWLSYGVSPWYEVDSLKYSQNNLGYIFNDFQKKYEYLGLLTFCDKSFFCSLNCNNELFQNYYKNSDSTVIVVGGLLPMYYILKNRDSNALNELMQQESFRIYFHQMNVKKRLSEFQQLYFKNHPNEFTNKEYKLLTMYFPELANVITLIENTYSLENHYRNSFILPEPSVYEYFLYNNSIDSLESGEIFNNIHLPKKIPDERVWYYAMKNYVFSKIENKEKIINIYGTTQFFN
jgi:hypothetical protein